MNVQIIEHNGVPEYAVIPFAEWQAITDRLEDMEDITDASVISTAIASGEETFPHEFSKRLTAGDSPLKVWREYRGFTLDALGKNCGVTAAALSQIETGKRSPVSNYSANLANFPVFLIVIWMICMMLAHCMTANYRITKL